VSATSTTFTVHTTGDLHTHILVPPRKRTLVSILIKIILAYSAINKKANPLAPYSMLNPETSSDSPSAKSKGARLVSAKEEVNHIIAKGIRNKESQDKPCSSESAPKL